MTADDCHHSAEYVRFGAVREGTVLVARRAVARAQNTPGVDFYFVVVVDKDTKRCLVRTVDGMEFWSPAWAFESLITQGEAEALGARWRIAPQDRPGLVGPARHPPASRGGDIKRKEGKQ